MNAIKILVLALFVASLTGCKWFVKDIEASYTPVPKPELVLPEADEIRMRELEWFIITPENAEEVFAEIEKGNNAVVLLGLTANGYERISLNLADVRGYIQQQQSIIAAYKKYYEEADKTIDNANEEIKKANGKDENED